MATTSTRTPARAASRGAWLVPVGLILLALIPIVSGSLRLTQLAGGPELIPAATRFSGSPIPVILHIVAGTLFAVVGAFQFVPALRGGRRSWHKVAGRVLIPAGFVLALSGLWMAVLYPHPVGDGPALVVIRVVFGSYMVVCLVRGVRAIVHRQFASHGDWMTRAYALGIAAGTQAIALIPAAVLFGPHDEVSRAIAMGGAWVVNIAIAELVIWRRAQRLAARRSLTIRPLIQTGITR